MEKPVRSSLQNLSISYECALAIGNSLNLPEMLQEVIHTMVHKTNAHRGIIWVENGDEKLQPVASAGINIEDVLVQGGIMGLKNVFNQILKRQQFVLRYKDDKDFLQYCSVLTGKEESVLIVPVTNVAILYLVYASREIADEPLANLLASLSKKLSVAIEACTAHENVIKEIQVREKAEKELTKKTEQLISSQNELQGLYGESEQARKSLLSILEDVTQKEDALKESESKLNSILSSIDDLVFVFDRDDRFILTQKTTSEQLYTTPEKFIGKKPSDVMPSHLNKIFSDAFDKIRKGQVAEYDYWLKIDGKTLWYSAKHSPRFIDGELVGSVAVVRDITERRRTEQVVRESEEKYRTLVQSISDAVFTMDGNGTYLFLNETAARSLGGKPEDFFGKNMRDVFPEEIAARQMEDITRVIASGCGEVLESVTMLRGKSRWYRTSIQPLKRQSGDTPSVLVIAMDITERKQLEAELLVKNEVFEASITANSTSDNEGILTYVNNSFVKILGYENKEEVVGKPISDFLKFEAEAMNIITALNETGVWEGEYTGLRKDKTTFNAYGLGTIIKDASGDTIGYQSAVLDISDRKRMEETLRESEEKYSSVVENSMDGIIVLQNGIIKFLNQAFLDLTGYNSEELIDKEFETLLSPEYRKLVMDRYQARLAGKDVPSMYEMEIIRKDGISVPIEASITIITYGGEKATLSFIRNITERKQAEKELRKLNEELEERVIDRTDMLSESKQALLNLVDDLNSTTSNLKFANERLLELDLMKSMFIASTSHELRTPLNSIIGFSSILLEGWMGEINPEQKEQLQLIHTAGKQLLALINDIIDISKIEAGKLETDIQEFGLKEVIDEAVSLVKNDIDEKGLDLEMEVEATTITSDKRRLLQCLINLLSNAVKFTDKGMITLHAKTINSMTNISITDTGTGIMPDDIKKLFGPFIRLESSLSAKTQGTGLGLYLTKKLTEDVLGGTVGVTSEYGTGSTFTINIPVKLEKQDKRDE